MIHIGSIALPKQATGYTDFSHFMLRDKDLEDIQVNFEDEDVEWTLFPDKQTIRFHRPSENTKAYIKVND